MADKKPELEDLEKTELESKTVPETELESPSPAQTSRSEVSVGKPPAVPPPLTHEFHEHEGRRWPTILVYLIIAFVVAALIVLAARAIYRGATNDRAEPAPSTNVPQPPGNATDKKTTKDKTSKPTASSPSTAAIPNTGPGNVLALFVGVSLAVGGLHYVYQLRRAG